MGSGRCHFLDGEGGEISGGILRIENLAIEKGFPPTACARWGFTIGNAGAFRRNTPNIFAIHLFNQGLGVGIFGQDTPAYILCQEPKIMGTEWIARMVAPEFHGIIKIGGAAAIAIIHLTTLARQDIGGGYVEPGATPQNIA